MNHLSKISPEDITEEQLIALVKMCEGEYFGGTARNVLQDLLEERAQLWSAFGGIVVTELLRHPGGLELFVRGFYGLGLVKHMRSVVAEFREIANARGCRWLGGAPASDRFAALYEKLGHRRVCTRLTMEV